MSLNKQPLSINFSKGLDTKSDPFRINPGNFLSLQNSVFTTTGRLTKRNGYQKLTNITVSGTPAQNVSTITTFKDNLTALGTSLYAYSANTGTWSNQGTIQPVKLDTLPLVRSSTNQTNQDAVIASNGLVCTVYKDSSTGNYFYQILDSNTGQQIVGQTALVTTAQKPRVFALGVYFIVMYYDSSGTALKYIAIPIATPSSPHTVATAMTSATAQWDGLVVVQNSRLYFGYNASSTTVKIAYLTSALSPSTATTLTVGVNLSILSLALDISLSWIFLSGKNGTSIYTMAVNFSLVQTLAPTVATASTGGTVVAVTSLASSGTCSIFYEVFNQYSYTTSDSLTPQTNYISKVTCNSAGTPGTNAVLIRSLGLASKAFTAANGSSYMVTVYGLTSQTPTSSYTNQSTYFLIDTSGNVSLKMAYENAGGYVSTNTNVLPSVSYYGGQYSFPYLITDFLTTINTTINTSVSPPVLAQANAIYTQTGINLAKIEIGNQQFSSEIASTLNLTGGILWEYDGVKPVENGFHLFPENIGASTATTGGSITAQTYFYSFTYEWTNNQGNIERSAPSIPVSITTTGSVSTNTIKVPTLRVTYKTTPNAVRIVGYRWSQGQQVFYQFTSITSPTANDPTVDSVTFTDTAADSSILGNPILYTTGGVVENIGTPASIGSALFDNRLWIIDAEDQNLLWFSKQVIENVPVEMSDLLTYYVAPTTSAQGSTGKLSAIYPMDDKLILFKKDAIYYVNGTGPDNTGSNSGYSQPIFVTSSVGTTNPNSIVLIPNGLMFQSDKGIWLLGRDLSTNYVGAPVESYNSQTVQSALNIPGTTQARFILDNNVTLMYDYFFNEWATHTNIQAISGTLNNGLHTYLSSAGNVYQELAGSYVDDSNPVLLSLTTGWINLAGLQGFERFYFANLLGTYFSPFKLQCSFAFNYNPSPSAYTVVTPNNYTVPYGNEAFWGSGGEWGSDQDTGSGSPANVFSAKLLPSIQKCQSFQVQLQEVFDASIGVSPGEGLTLSGLALIVGMKKGYRTQSAAKSFG